MTLEDFAVLFQEEVAKFIEHMDKRFAKYEAKQKDHILTGGPK